MKQSLPVMCKQSEVQKCKTAAKNEECVLLQFGDEIGVYNVDDDKVCHVNNQYILKSTTYFDKFSKINPETSSQVRRRITSRFL